MATRPQKKSRLPLVFMLALLVLISYFLVQKTFRLSKVEVYGAEIYSQEDIVRFSGITFGGSIFQLDCEAAVSRLTLSGQVIPISVEVAPPDTCVIRVKERVPRAYLSCYGNYLVLDENGMAMRLLENSQPPEGLIYVSGIQPTTHSVGQVIASSARNQVDSICKVIAAVFETGRQGYISELNAANPSSMYFVTDGGMKVMIGDSTLLPDKLALMTSVIDRLRSEGGEFGVLDVSTGKTADYRQNI